MRRLQSLCGLRSLRPTQRLVRFGWANDSAGFGGITAKERCGAGSAGRLSSSLGLFGHALPFSEVVSCRDPATRIHFRCSQGPNLLMIP